MKTSVEMKEEAITRGWNEEEYEKFMQEQSCSCEE